MTDLKRIILISIIFAFVFQALAQQDSLKPNNISFAPFVLADRTIPVSYSRFINHNWNYSLYLRYRFARDDGTTIEQGWFENIDKFHQPYIYSRAFLRTGVQYHNKWYLLEPLLQLDRGWLRDRSLVVYDSGEDSALDITETQDRDYYSAGMVFLAGTYHDYERTRFRTFIGFGTHLKLFQVDAKSAWNAEPDWEPYYEEYFKFMLSVHLGMEIGFNF